MSVEKKPTYSLNYEPQKKFNWSIALAIILVLLIVFLIIIFSNTSKQSKIKLAPANHTQNQANPPATTQSTNNKNQLQSYLGKIVAIDQGQIKLQLKETASPTANFLIIGLNQDTKFFKLTVPKTLSADPDKNKLKQTSVNKDYLKVGQQILAVAKQISGNKFLANKIEVQEIK